MAKGKKEQSRAQAKAANKSRPQATSQPSAGIATARPLTAYSPSGSHFAILTQSIDRHRLAIYDASIAAGKLLVDYVLPTSPSASSSTEAAKCTALSWVRLPSTSVNGEAATPQSKRQKKSKRASFDNEASAEASSSTSAAAGASSSSKPFVALGLQNGQIHLFDLAMGKVTRILADSSAATSASNAGTDDSIASISSPSDDAAPAKLYAIAKDGIVRVWDLRTAATETSDAPVEPISRINPASRSVPNTLLSTSPSSSRLLVASHTISLLDQSTSTTKATFTSHASPLTHLVWLSDDHFVSAAKNDPVLYLWNVTRSKAPVASIELEQGEDVVRVQAHQNGTLAVLGDQGFIGIYDVTSYSKAGTSPGKTTALLKPQSSTSSPHLVDVQLDAAAERLSVARLVKGVKLELIYAQVRDPATASILSQFSVPASSASGNILSSSDDTTVTAGINSLQRYRDPTTAVARQGAAGSGPSALVGDDGMVLDGRDAPRAEDDGALDLDGGIDDERTLEERLRGLRVLKRGAKSSSAAGGSLSDNDDDEGARPSKAASGIPTTSLSLATSLSQALHSSDASLISSLLVASNASLVKSTVVRLSGPNAVRLLEACIDRLNGSNRSSSHKSRGLIEWVKWTLRLHAGYLMSLPGLTARLARLHAVLSNRLSAQNRLLALQGRLELVLGQIELRSEYDVAQAKIQGVKSKGKTIGGGGAVSSDAGAIKKGRVWKEDEDDVSSSSEDEDDVEGEGMDVDVDDSDSDLEDEDDDDDDDDDEDDSDEDDISVDSALAAEEEGETDDIGLESGMLRAPGQSSSSSDEEDEDEEAEEDDAPSRKTRRSNASANTSANAKTKTPSTTAGIKGKNVKGASIGAAAATSSSDEDEEMESDEEDDDQDEDESDLESDSDLLDDDDEEDEEDEEDDEDDEDGDGLIDDMAEEGSEESESEEEEEE